MSNANAASWLIWALLSAFFAALTAICAKVGVETIDSDLATLFRTLLIAVILGVLVIATGKLRPISAIPVRSWTFLALSGLATGASWLCYFRALKLGSAAKVAPIDKLSVVIVAVLSATLLGEQISLRGWIGVALIGVGAVLVAVA